MLAICDVRMSVTQPHARFIRLSRCVYLLYLYLCLCDQPIRNFLCCDRCRRRRRRREWMRPCDACHAMRKSSTIFIFLLIMYSLNDRGARVNIHTNTHASIYSVREYNIARGRESATIWSTNTYVGCTSATYHVYTRDTSTYQLWARFQIVNNNAYGREMTIAVDWTNRNYWFSHSSFNWYELNVGIYLLFAFAVIHMAKSLRNCHFIISMGFFVQRESRAIFMLRTSKWKRVMRLIFLVSWLSQILSRAHRWMLFAACVCKEGSNIKFTKFNSNKYHYYF